MIGTRQETHPASETLAAFALGRLEDDEATSVADHLGVCESCQQAVLAVPDDSMLALLRPAGCTPVPRPGLLPATASAFVEGLPLELHNHPRYRVLRPLGAGGMGVVYLAEHRLMERTVALKVISKQLTASPAVVERFRREVRAVARLAHPNLVQAHDAEQEGDLHFLVMEFVEGENLAWLVDRNGPLPVEKACDYVRQAALGLAHALTLGLVHRDVKPQNLIVTAQGQVKVLDFGLASIAEERGGGLTEFGQGMGTPDYVAPEQIRDAHSADARADVYSLGCTLYFLLTGRPPFPEGNAAQKVAAHLEKQPTPLKELRPETPVAVVQVIERMMAKAPALRYQTPADVVAALEPWCLPVSQPRQRPGRSGALSGRWRRTLALAAAAGLLLIAAALTHLWFAGPPPSPQPPGGAESPAVPAAVKPGDPPPDLVGVTPLFDDDFRNPNTCHFPAYRDKDDGATSWFQSVVEQAAWVWACPRFSAVEASLALYRAVTPVEPTGRYLLQRGRSRLSFRGPDHCVEGDFACEVVGRTLGADGGCGMSLAFAPGHDRFLFILIRRDAVVELSTLARGRYRRRQRLECARPPAT